MTACLCVCVFCSCHESEVIARCTGLDDTDPFDDTEVSEGLCEEDMYESGSLAAAPLMTPPFEVNAAICASPDCVADETGATDECDVFVVYLEPGESIEATLEFVHEDGDLDLLVVDKYGNLMVSSLSDEAPETTPAFLVSEAGSFFVFVCGWNCASNNYLLRVSSVEL